MSSRRRVARVCAAISIAAVSLLAPAAAIGRSAAAVPTLGAVNHIDASRTSFTTVRLAEPMLLNENHGTGKFIAPGLTVSDPAKFVALALVADKGVRFSSEQLYLQRPTFFVWRMPTGSTNTISDSANSDHNVLPAGTYRLTVVATGPEHLTWRLPLKARGVSTRTTTSVNVPYKVQTWTGPAPVVSYFAHARTTPISQLWGSVWVSATEPPHTGGNTTCWYNASDPSAAQTETIPGVCQGQSVMGGPVDGVYLPPIPESTSPTPRAGAMTIDATQKVNSDFLPEPGVKGTVYRAGPINAATVFTLWLPIN